MKHLTTTLIIFILMVVLINACGTGGSNPKKAAKIRSECLLQSIKDNTTEAVDLCRQAIALEPENYQGYSILASIYKEQEDYFLAITNYEKAIEYATKDSEDSGMLYGLYMDMGMCYQENGDDDEALEAYNQAKSIQPDQADVVDGYIENLGY